MIVADSDNENQTQADRIEAVLTRITDFLDRIEPHLPLLDNLGKTLDNPAARYLLGGRKRT